jgi:hypothetical protein
MISVLGMIVICEVDIIDELSSHTLFVCTGSGSGVILTAACSKLVYIPTSINNAYQILLELSILKCFYNIVC